MPFLHVRLYTVKLVYIICNLRGSQDFSFQTHSSKVQGNSSFSSIGLVDCNMARVFKDVVKQLQSILETRRCPLTNGSSAENHSQYPHTDTLVIEVPQVAGGV